jgi:hypothetical protein
MGYALGVAQLGGKHPHAKPWKGEGCGVFEIVEDHSGDSYRAVYTVRFAEGLAHATLRPDGEQEGALTFVGDWRARQESNLWPQD